MLPISGAVVDQATIEGMAKTMAKRRNAAAINAFSMAFQKVSNLVMTIALSSWHGRWFRS